MAPDSCAEPGQLILARREIAERTRKRAGRADDRAARRIPGLVVSAEEPDVGVAKLAPLARKGWRVSRLRGARLKEEAHLVAV